MERDWDYAWRDTTINFKMHISKYKTRTGTKIMRNACGRLGKLNENRTLYSLFTKEQSKSHKPMKLS